MKLYIQVENNQTINHPALETNLLEAFGSIPSNWEPFIRVERPVPDLYELLESDVPVYAKVDGVWTDVWPLRPMTVEEKTAKQQAVIDELNTHEQAENWSAWTLDEATCTMQPPIPRPEPDETKLEKRIYTFWCGADNNWKDTPVLPEGNYKFDFFAWQWIEITE
jgi:hypothetical protein